MLNSIDFSRCLVGSVILSSVSLLPALLASLLLREHRRGVVYWVLGSWFFLLIVLFLWPAFAFCIHPYQSSSTGSHIGVSWISVTDIIQAMLRWLWLPATAIIATLLGWITVMRKQLSHLSAVIKVYVLLASVFSMAVFYFGGFHQEDTRTSPMFAVSRFYDVTAGMSLSQVQAILGQSLRQEVDAHDKTVLVYAESMRTGWNVTVTIDRNRSCVVDKKMWWAD